jgi:hypothetical protein
VDVRWLSHDNQRTGIVVKARGPLGFSASHFTAHDLYAAYHTYDLKPRVAIILNIDYRQSGLGTACCGPGVSEPYKIRPGRYAWSYDLLPYEL